VKTRFNEIGNGTLFYLPHEYETGKKILWIKVSSKTYGIPPGKTFTTNKRTGINFVGYERSIGFHRQLVYVEREKEDVVV